MSETETAVPMDDKALFDAAISTEAPAAEMPTAAPAEAATEQTKDENRDPATGRFVPKAEPEQAPAQAVAEQQPQQAAPPQQGEAIPSWRLKEEAEARRQAEGRAQQLERQLHDLSGRLKQLEKPADPIDPYVDPEKFRDQGVRQALTPLEQRLAQQTEYFSRELTVRDFGKEAVDAAYDAMDQALRSGDQNAAAVKERMNTSPDPYREMVKWHRQTSLLSAIGDDPEKFLTSKLAEMAKDPAKRDQLLAIINPAQQQQGTQANQQTTNVVKLPPSLNRQPGAQAPSTGGMDDKSLYAFATS